MGSRGQVARQTAPNRRGPSQRRLIGWLCRRHNLVQLLGYEFGNLALLAQHGLAPGEAGLFEALAAASFMLGSLSICLFDPEQRPSLLFFGGLWLTAGGLMLVLAGFPLTGGAVMLASLETARGGLPLMRTVQGFEGMRRDSSRVVVELARTLMAPYCRMVRATVDRFPKVGGFIQGRPFVASAIIKMPLRLEFVLRNLLLGDVVGVAIGCSWMLGDGALALNDQHLNEQLRQAFENEQAGAVVLVTPHPAIAPAPVIPKPDVYDRS